MPRVQSLPRPNPEARRNANYESHQVFNHIHSEVRGHARPRVHRAGDRQRPTVVTEPAAFPVRTKGLLVKEASDDNGGRNRVENAENANSHH